MENEYKDEFYVLLEEQFKSAGDIQNSFFPKRNIYFQKDIQVSGFSMPAYHIGGDYFNYFGADENKLCAVICDVEGKGIDAAMITAMIHILLKEAVFTHNLGSSAILSYINRGLSLEFIQDKFVTMLFLIYNASKHELTFSNAGHCPLYLFSADKKAFSSFEPDGFPLGISPDAVYENATVPFSQGDIAIMFTDGIYETKNMENENYGIERIQKLVAKKYNFNAEEIISSLDKSLKAFRGEQAVYDDMTAIVIKRD